MAKWVNPAVLDAALAEIAGADSMAVLSGAATSFGEATSKTLASVAMAPSDFSLSAGSPDGRRVAIASKTDVLITATGTATHVALIDAATSTLLYVTTTNEPVALAADGRLTIDAWDISIGEPT